MARNALPDDPLKRPPQKWLDNFRLTAVGDNSVGSYIERRFSLCIYCVDCPRVIEWAPAELTARFGERPGVRIADIVARLTCSCGSRSIAAGPKYNPLTPQERLAASAVEGGAAQPA